MKILPTTFLICLAGFATSANAGQNPFVGEAMIFAGTFCPTGYLPMDGRLLSIQQYTALFSLLGSAYGGDGRSTFALPTANTLLTANRQTVTQCMATTGIYPQRP